MYSIDRETPEHFDPFKLSKHSEHFKHSEQFKQVEQIEIVGLKEIEFNALECSRRRIDRIDRMGLNTQTL